MPPQGSKIKPKILSAAIALFGTWGYQGVTYALIARKAGCFPPAIFRNFKNMRGLYIEAIALVVDEVQKAMTPFAISLVSGAGDANEKDRAATVTQVVEAWYKGLSRDGARFLLQVILSDPKRRPEIEKALDLLPKILVQTARIKMEGDSKVISARAVDLANKLFYLKCIHAGTPEAELREVDRHLKEWLRD